MYKFQKITLSQNLFLRLALIYSGFQAARGHCIERKVYLDDLLQNSCRISTEKKKSRNHSTKSGSRTHTPSKQKSVTNWREEPRLLPAHNKRRVDKAHSPSSSRRPNVRSSGSRSNSQQKKFKTLIWWGDNKEFRVLCYFFNTPCRNGSHFFSFQERCFSCRFLLMAS